MSGEEEVRATPVARLAARLGCTEGQGYTVTLGLVVALLLALTGLPPVLRDRLGTIPVAASDLGPVPATPLAPAAASPTPGETITADAAPSVFPGSSGSSSFRGARTESTLPIESASAPTSAPPTSARPKLPFGTVSLLTKVGQPGSPHGVAVTPSGTVVVATNNASSVPSELQVFSGTGILQRRWPVTGQPTSRTSGLTGVAIDATDAAVTLDASTSRVLRINLATGAQDVFGTIPDVPACMVVGVTKPCEPGAADRAPRPSGLAFDVRGRLFVTDAGQATVWVFDRSGAQPWLQSIDFATGNGLTGLAIDASSVLLSVASSYNTDNPLGGEVYRVGLLEDGTAGASRSIAHFARGSTPGGVAIGPGGDLYVTLSEANAVAVLQSDGKERSRFTSKAGDPVAFEAPSTPVVWGSSLLVTNESSVTAADRWAVLEVGIVK